MSRPRTRPRPDPPAIIGDGLVTAPAADRASVLLSVAQAVAAHAELPTLLEHLARALEPHLRVGYFSFALVDPETHSARLQTLRPLGGGAVPAVADTPAELPAGESPAAYVSERQEPFWLTVAGPGGEDFPVLRAAFARQGVHAACFVPLTTPRKKLGAMGFVSYEPVVPSDADIDFTLHIGRLVALAVEGALTRQELERANQRLVRERDRLGLLNEVGEAVTARLDMTDMLRAVTAGLRKLVGLPLTTLLVPDPAGRTLRSPAADAGADGAPGLTEVVISETPAGRAYETGNTVCLGPGELDRLPPVVAAWAADHNGRSFCAVPLVCGGSRVGVLALLGRDPDTFSDDIVGLLEAVARPVAVAVANATAYRRIEELTDRLAAEKLYLQEEILADRAAGDILGRSPALVEILSQVEIVAGTDSAVLITGETGTGKELIARAVHAKSPRKDRTFVKLNCAAIPATLLESELFGHEKGAFTGATDRRVGRFELADGGTLFLDEIGDIPAELQPKLLRVLQEQEFERLGSGKTVKVSVRIVAATHRNLAEMVAAGTFRSDLYYRLHVFPLHLPPLRDRRDDIPELVRHFVGLFARRFGRTIDTITTDDMSALKNYAWPGNVRELEHLIERSVILTRGRELRVPLADLTVGIRPSAAPAVLPAETVPPIIRPTLRDTERETIRRALEECRWRVGGPDGAAARLGLKRTTLISRMKKLGMGRGVEP